MSDPMDAVELERIRQRIDRTPVVPFTIAEPGVARVQMSDLRRIVHDAMSLLCEVERMQVENARMRVFVEEIASFDDTEWCPHCERTPQRPHVAECRIVKARALLAQEP